MPLATSFMFFTGSLLGLFTLETNEQLIGNGVALVVGGHTLRVAGTAPTINNPAGNSILLREREYSLWRHGHCDRRQSHRRHQRHRP
jgi:hypothetical protein